MAGCRSGQAHPKSMRASDRAWAEAGSQPADAGMLRAPAAWQAVPDSVFRGADVHCLDWAPSSAASVMAHLAAGVGSSLACSSWWVPVYVQVLVSWQALLQTLHQLQTRTASASAADCWMLCAAGMPAEALPPLTPAPAWPCSRTLCAASRGRPPTCCCWRQPAAITASRCSSAA